jgi:hypothetical protein
MYIMDDNERNKENNFRKLQEKQMRQAKRHRNAAQTEIQQSSRRDHEFGSVAAATIRRENGIELARLHLVAANILEISADPSTRPEQKHIFDAAAEAVQQALTKMREVHGRTFTPEAGSAGRKKTKHRKSRRKHKKTKSRKSRRKHKKTKRKQRR